MHPPVRVDKRTPEFPRHRVQPMWSGGRSALRHDQGRRGLARFSASTDRARLPSRSRPRCRQVSIDAGSMQGACRETDNSHETLTRWGDEGVLPTPKEREVAK